MALQRKTTGTGRKPSTSNNAKKTATTGKKRRAQPTNSTDIKEQLYTTANEGVMGARQPTQQEREKKMAEQLRKQHADVQGYKEAYFQKDDRNQKLLAKVAALEKELKASGSQM